MKNPSTNATPKRGEVEGTPEGVPVLHDPSRRFSALSMRKTQTA
jgi:hypothetical protein